MHTTKVVLKTGLRYEGWIVTWRPVQGYLVMNNAEANELIMIKFAEAKSIVTLGQRVNINLIEDQDELERARQDGWEEPCAT